jgi:hypothetical protein
MWKRSVGTSGITQLGELQKHAHSMWRCNVELSLCCFPPNISHSLPRHYMDDGSEWSASRPGRFISGERLPPGTHWLGFWEDPTTSLDTVAKRNFVCPCRELNPGFPARSLLTILQELQRNNIKLVDVFRTRYRTKLKFFRQTPMPIFFHFPTEEKPKRKSPYKTTDMIP